MPRINQRVVAERAGVSVATVDRVLNGRPGVRAQTAERVNAVVRELDYFPDPIAARLARSRSYRFGFVLPIGANVFMDAIEAELAAAAKRLAPDRVGIETTHADVFDGQRLADCLDGLREGFDGVAVVALDHPAVREAIDSLVQRGVHVVTFVSDLPASRRARYIGIDNYAAGRTAASLLGRFTGRRRGSVGLIAGSLALRDHAERKHGFEQVLWQEFPHLKLMPSLEGYDDAARSERAAVRLLSENDDIVALYSAGAGNGGIINALERSGPVDLVFVAHELTPESRRALVRGTMDAVINQDAGHEVRSALRVLQAITDDRPIVQSQERIRIDVFLRDNMPPQT